MKIALKGKTLSTPRMIQVAPNKFAPRQLDFKFEPPTSLWCDPVPNGDGTFSLQPRSWEHYLPVTSELCQKLGMGTRTDTLRRLINGGFVLGSHITPRIYVVNVVSYWEHFTRCGEDPDYWTDPVRLRTFWTGPDSRNRIPKSALK